jgi:nitroreductase
MDDTGTGELYDEIFRRKSVRRYEDRALDGALRDAAAAAAQAAAPLNDAPAALRVIPAKEAGVSFGKAPCCLCGYAKNEDAARLNAACMLQEASLRLSRLGLGSCWLGMAKPGAGCAEYRGLPFFKLLVFGYPAEALHRGAEGFNRKPRAEITGIAGEDALTEALRLAPSAMNRQGWFLSRSGNRLRLYMAGNNFLLKRLMDPLTIADAGIALCHLVLAARREGRFRSAPREEGIPPIRKNYSYVGSIELAE